jgi:hypothetical protein
VQSALRRHIAAAIVAIGMLGSSVAHATPTARLVYLRGSGAETCADQATLRQAVAARLGYDPFRPLADNTVSVSVTRSPGRFEAQVVLIDTNNLERGNRKLVTRDACGELTAALALTISIALDPLSLTRIPDSVATVPASPAPTPANATATDNAAEVDADPAGALLPKVTLASPPVLPASVQSPRARAVASTVREVWFTAGLGAHAAFGAAPAPAFGLNAYGGIRYGARLAFDLGARLDLPASRGTAEGGAVTTSLYALALASCLRFSPLALCPVVTVGQLRAETSDISQPRASKLLYLAVAGRATVAIAIVKNVFVQLAGEFGAPLQPYEFQLNGKTVFTLPPAYGMLGVSPSILF